MTEDISQRVLYRDGMMLVINKPAGYAVHGGVGKGKNLRPLLEDLKFGLDQPPELAHRLDKDTSGCLVLGRNRKSLAHLGQLFATGKIRKSYWAVVVGTPKEKTGEVSAPLRKLERQFGWIVVVDKNRGQPSITQWKLLGQTGRISWLEVYPLTGRTHQIRAHLAHLGHPILGDSLYGRGTADLLADQLHLHARAITIPKKKNSQTVTAPPPDHMLEHLKACGYTPSDLQLEMTPQNFILDDEASTIELGKKLASKLKIGDIIALYGSLGSGKTTLARAIIRALTSPTEEVPSPSFTLVQTYDTTQGPLWHFDLYRLENSDEAWELGIEEAFDCAISLIEWPERLETAEGGSLLPPQSIRLHLTQQEGDQRMATINNIPPHILPIFEKKSKI